MRLTADNFYLQFCEHFYVQEWSEIAPYMDVGCGCRYICAHVSMYVHQYLYVAMCVGQENIPGILWLYQIMNELQKKL